MTDQDLLVLPGNAGLRKYEVKLIDGTDNGTDSDWIYFECWADDTEHAIEQASSAYPGCEIAGCDSPGAIQ